MKNDFLAYGIFYIGKGIYAEVHTYCSIWT